MTPIDLKARGREIVKKLDSWELCAPYEKKQVAALNAVINPSTLSEEQLLTMVKSVVRKLYSKETFISKTALLALALQDASLDKDMATLDENQRFERLKLLAALYPTRTALNFKKYKISDEAKRLEIALIIAEYCSAAVSVNMNNFAISDEKSRVKIAKTAAKQDGCPVVSHISNYTISDQDDLLEILFLAADTSGEEIKRLMITYPLNMEAVWSKVELRIELGPPPEWPDYGDENVEND